MFRSSQVDKLIDKATSNLLLEPDWVTILQLCDLIRQGDCNAKYALQLLMKKLNSDNPHGTYYALLVLESLVKNCGAPMHDEVATRAFMDQLRELHRTTPYENVKGKILELLQTWAFAFRHNAKYRAVQDIVFIMRSEGQTFPALKESDAMFAADTPPTWADGESCHRCRTQFGVVTRKHHCRACGQVFCGQCSSKTSVIPKYGYEKEVRVCEACYAWINRPPTVPPKESELPPEYLNSSLAQQSQTPARKTEEELREEEDLQLAIALSQSEAEEKEKKKTQSQQSQQAKSLHHNQSSGHFASLKAELQEEVDPELARYLNRDYWEQRSSEDRKKTSSPQAQTSVNSASSQKSDPFTGQVTPTQQNKPVVKLQQNGNAEDSEIDNFVQALRSQVEIFVNRMKSNSSRGRNISNDSSVQTLFMNITAMHSRLLRYIQQQDDSRVYYEGLQDKLAQVKDARAALDALRYEHREKLRLQAVEAERQRQLQMAQKLDIMRQKKQEYLQFQRQLALQRIQEQEREMHVRQEQQKQQYLMGTGPFYIPAQGGGPGFPLNNVPPFQSGNMMPPGMYQAGPNGQPGPGQQYMAFPPRFALQMPQGMMPGTMMGGPQGGPMPPGGPQGGPMPPGGPQGGPMPPGGPQGGPMPPGGPQGGPMPQGGPQANLMGPGGQMVPGGPPNSQVGPVPQGAAGPLPGHISMQGPQPGQMGPPPGSQPQPQPGSMGPAGHIGPHVAPGQVLPLGVQAAQMLPPGQQPGALGSAVPQPAAPQPVQMAPNGAPGMTNPNHVMGQGVSAIPQPEETKKSEELISFD